MLSGDSVEALSLEDRMKIQVKKKKPLKTVSDPGRKKRANKNRPREMSSKRPVYDRPSGSAGNPRPVDPRFDGLYGEYNAEEFRQNYDFVEAMQKRDAAKLKRSARKQKDPEKLKKTQAALKRMTDRERELERVRALRQKAADEKAKMAEALAQGKPIRFKTKTEKKLGELVDKFGELKEKGKLLKYIKKKTKSKPRDFQ
ncbi:unnamed protein product [Nesidiocoris tenuis]|uniref:Uncharacterized protein n=2 Tax=Nesidiocoris tenuis TaxID=355587 RepID=A0ABN7AZF3_9HEMI|nr:Domain of unknown function (DUF947) [Nesidiocoris tenuis]CAB0013032.1 unnamed protein product [Nesidiocoris tenuis]